MQSYKRVMQYERLLFSLHRRFCGNLPGYSEMDTFKIEALGLCQTWLTTLKLSSIN